MKSEQRHHQRQLFKSLADINAAIDRLNTTVQELRTTLRELTEIRLIESQGKQSKAASAEAELHRDHDDNFTRVATYLRSMNGVMVTIKQIATLTNIPQSSLRVMLYQSRRHEFRSEKVPGTRERVWQLANSDHGPSKTVPHE